jgi:hypothetical protein
MPSSHGESESASFHRETVFHNGILLTDIQKRFPFPEKRIESVLDCKPFPIRHPFIGNPLFLHWSMKSAKAPPGYRKQGLHPATRSNRLSCLRALSGFAGSGDFIGRVVQSKTPQTTVVT